MDYYLQTLDSRIRYHLSYNGKMTDPVGMQLTMKFVQRALKTPMIRDASQRYGFTSEDLGLIYASMIEGLRPNPCIRNPSVTYLAASIIFIEPFRIESLLAEIHRNLEPGMEAKERRDYIIEEAVEHAKATLATHVNAYGQPNFEMIDPKGTGLPSADGCGCLGTIIFGGVSTLLYFAAKGAFGLTA